MNFRSIAATFAAFAPLLLAACANEGNPGGEARGETFSPVAEAEFRSSVVGKTLAYDKGGDLTFNSDGTLSGMFPDGAASGTWAWEGSRICSRTTVGAKDFRRTCRTPQLDGDRIRFLAEDGSVFGLASIR